MNPVIGGIITATFDEPRPLSNPGLHIHGALDIAQNPRGIAMVHAPFAGTAQAFVFIRPPNAGWQTDGHGLFMDKPEIRDEPLREYWEDIYGGVIALEEPTGRFHVMTHFFFSQLNARFGLTRYVETRAKSRWPCRMFTSVLVRVKRGEPLCNIGNAGFSTGPHLHWEVHNSRKLDRYEKRIDPATLI